MKRLRMPWAASYRYIFVFVFLLNLVSLSAEARSYEYHADSLDISFKAIRRPGAGDFTFEIRNRFYIFVFCTQTNNK